MALPKYDEFYPDVLTVLADGEVRKVATIRDEISKARGFSPEELSEMLPSKAGTVYSNRVHWALQYLFQAGLIERPRRGYYQISQEGLDYIAKDGFNVTTADLEQFDSYVDFRSRSTPKKANVNPLSPSESTKKVSTISQSEETPEDLMATAHKLLNQQLSDDLMQAIMDMDPIFFEKLVLDLLISMGYGGRDNANIIRTPASGDGGIDGLIKEDELGLEYIYVQAKRWQKDNQVSRPEIQKFVGALVGEGARKGVFITTSDFSSAARKYAEGYNAGKVVLINGEELTQLMITYGVGVSMVHQYSIQKVDTDYFVQE